MKKYLDNITDEQAIKLCNFTYGPTEEEEDSGNVEIRTGTCGHDFRIVKTKKQKLCYFCEMASNYAKNYRRIREGNIKDNV